MMAVVHRYGKEGKHGFVYDVRDNSYHITSSTHWRLATEEEFNLLHG